MRFRIHYLSFVAGALAIGLQNAHAQYISTYAGDGFGAATGTGAYTGDGGLAVNARLNSPTGVIFDGAGNVFIADYGNSVVRKVNTVGIITTVAGTGTAGINADTMATAAQLNHPAGVAVDATGNLFIADFGNHVVRKVTPDGIIRTYAGTGAAGYTGDNSAATLAQLNNPGGIALDAAGNLYIAETGNHIIRKVSTTGIITTVAGLGVAGSSGNGGPAIAAKLNAPSGVAVDALGNVYIADLLNNVVRKVNTSGIISNFAGTGAQGFSGDNGPASMAALNRPSSLSVVGLNTVYITDQGNSRVRVVDSLGTIRTFAGRNTNGYSGDGGLATSAELSSPRGVAADGWSRVYIADYDNNVIRVVTTGAASVTALGAAAPSVYPNPAMSELHISAPFAGSYQLRITDMLGRVAIERQLPGGESTVQLAGLVNGSYIVHFQGAEGACSQYLVVSK